MRYNFEFTVIKEQCDKFKQKQVAMLMHIIGGGRLIRDMEFNSYAYIDFEDDDVNHLRPMIEETEGFNRLKTNCLVYNLKNTDFNPGFYDKLFIYQNNGAKGNGYYGWIMYNTKTGEQKHKYYITRTEDELCRQLHKTFYIMHNRKHYIPYI